ncbi:hypothetical protein MmiAt1_01860 [Methanimicrococcus sp. At1]|uniref:Uncharacterized protein n=1 Tax=Methanimicrococcus hacksteinii TaxID=3028293 RepID=A0ABU3VMU6_9EURY|nr:hypothetical protein [Methanimicrococcus sp. At1]
MGFVESYRYLIRSFYVFLFIFYFLFVVFIEPDGYMLAWSIIFVQIWIAFYCISNCGFFMINVRRDSFLTSEGIFLFFYLTGYLLNAIILPFLLLTIFDNLLIYFTGNSFVWNSPLFIYAFILIFDIVFISFFRHIHKISAQGKNPEELWMA